MPGPSPRVSLWHKKVIAGGLCCCLEDAPKEFLSASQGKSVTRSLNWTKKIQTSKKAGHFSTFCQKIENCAANPERLCRSAVASYSCFHVRRQSSYHQSLLISFFPVGNRMSVQPQLGKACLIYQLFGHEVLNIGTSRCVGHLTKATSGSNLSPRLLGQHRGPAEHHPGVVSSAQNHRRIKWALGSLRGSRAVPTSRTEIRSPAR